MAHEGKLLVGSFLLVPLLMGGTKILRMDSREKHEVQMEIRYRAVFWERANVLVKSLNDKICSVATERTAAEQEGKF